GGGGVGVGYGAAVGVGEVLSYLAEQAVERLRRLDGAAGHAARMDDPGALVLGRLVALGDQRLDRHAPADRGVGVAAQLLGLGLGGLDPAVGQQRGHEVVEQRRAMRSIAAELSS